MKSPFPIPKRKESNEGKGQAMKIYITEKYRTWLGFKRFSVMGVCTVYYPPALGVRYYLMESSRHKFGAWFEVVRIAADASGNVTALVKKVNAPLS